jgi:RHS repeat-associated protein
MLQGFILTTLIITASQLVALAQNAQPNVQFNQKAVDFGGRGDLRVNPTTLALELQIPLGNYPGRAGLSLPVTISYSSKLWRVDYYTYIPGPVNSSGNPTGEGYTRVQARYAEHSSSGWTSSLGFPFFDNTPTQYYDINGSPKPDANSCGSSGCYVVDRLLVWMPDGSSHELRSTDQPRAVGSGGPLPDDLYAVDGSRIRYQRSTQTLFMPDGGRYLFATGQYVDRNGNTLTAANNSWVDTLGRGIGLPPLATTAGTYNYSLPGVGGASVNYTFVWKNLGDPGVLTNGQSPQYVANSGCPVGTGSYSPSLFQSDVLGTRTCIQNASGIFNPVVLYQIQLPTGQSYTLTYNVYGEIDKVQLPTGGYERYEYAQNATLGSMSFPYTQANRGVANRFVSTGAGAPETQWHYEGGGIVRITAPDNTLVERYIHSESGNNWGYSANGARTGMAYDERTYSAPDAGNVRHMLRRTLTEWSVTGSNAVGLVGVGNANRNPRVTKRVEILLDTGTGNALAKTTVYGYDTTYQFSTGVNKTSVSEYDYVTVDQNTAQTGAIGSIPIPSQPARIAETTYLDSNSSYRLKNILGLTTSVTVKKDANTVLSQTTMSYDESTYQLGNTYGTVTQWAAPTGVRGNITTVSGWLDSPNSYVQKHRQYDQCGSVVGSWDANGNKTQISYDGLNAYAYPTTVTTPAPNSDAVSYTSGGTTYNFTAGAFGSITGFTTYVSYDPYTGLVTSTIDANGRSTTFEHNDPLNRLTKENRPDGGWTSYDYGRNQWGTYVHTSALVNASGTTAYTYQYADGLGRLYRSFIYDPTDANNSWLTADTQYDTLGRTWRVSNPYRSTGSAGAINPSGRWTTTAYDDLGRVKTVTPPDGATMTTSYVGNTVTVTDAAGRKRSSMSDALGRLTQVTEDPTTGGLNYVTNYTYDALDNLRKVDQGGQVRFFMYDSLSRLIRAKNPEQAVGSVVSNMTDPLTGNSQWSLAYGYDNNGNLTARVDARDVTTNYTYDHLNRNIVTYYTPPAGGGVGSTPDIRHYYDNTAGGMNGLGRLYWSQAVGVSASVFDAYDAMGRPTNYHQVYWVSGAWGQPFNVSRAYDKASNITSQTYPSGRTVSYSYDPAGRMSSFTGNLGDGVSRTYSTGVTYSEMGGIQEERFGTSTPLYHKMHYNVRGQLYDVRLSTVSFASDQWAWNRGALINFYSTADYSANDTTRSLSGADNNGNVRRSYHFVPLDAAGAYGSSGNGSYAYYYEDYNYDSLNRITSDTETAGTSSGSVSTPFQQSYSYDRLGNRTINAGQTWGVPSTQFELSPQTNQEVAEPSNRLYASGDSGRAPAQKLMRYDKAGNLTYDAYTGQGARVYDAENRVAQAQDIYQQWSTYTYDADGRRVKRLIANQETWQVYGMGGELVAEYQSGAAPMVATKEYGYRGGALLVTMASGDDQRLKRFIKNLYYNCLARDPNATDLQDKTNLLALAGVQGESQLLTAARSVARGLFESAEYTARGRTNTQYVTDLYNAYLQRAPDTTGLNFWVQDAQNNGRGHTLDSFEVSTEFITLSATVYGTASGGDNQRVDNFIDEFYLGAYNRFPTTAERSPQEQRLNNAAAVSQEQVKSEARLMGAEIFQATNYNSTHTDSQYVTDLYEAFLQRAPDGLGLSFWLSKVQNEGRASALVGFQNSTEFGELAGTLYRETFWLVPDHLGTPRMVVDKSGSLAGVKRHDYLPFGEEVSAGVGGRIPNQGYSQLDAVRQKFTAYERDNETGVDYAFARRYSSAQGRFTSPDPFGGSGYTTVPQSWNRYTYCLNRPSVFTDPTGLIWLERGNIVIYVDDKHYDAKEWKGWTQILNGSIIFVAGLSNGYKIYYGGLVGHYVTLNANGTISEAPDPRDTVRATYSDEEIKSPLYATLGSLKTGGSKNTPARGGPKNTSVKFPNEGGGYTERWFDQDGDAWVDIDYGHDHGAGDPHVHWWDWDKPLDGARGEAEKMPKGWESVMWDDGSREYFPPGTVGVSVMPVNPAVPSMPFRPSAPVRPTVPIRPMFEPAPIMP